MKYFQINPKDIEGAYVAKTDVGLSVPYEQHWVEFNGKKYWCRKIANEDWTVTEIGKFPFTEWSMKGGDTHMMKKKGMTKNQKLKTLKTSKAKKLVKSTKK